MDAWAKMYTILPTTKTSRTTATLRTTRLPALHLRVPPKYRPELWDFQWIRFAGRRDTDHVQILGRERKARSAPQLERIGCFMRTVLQPISSLYSSRYNPCITSLGSLGILQFLGSAVCWVQTFVCASWPAESMLEATNLTTSQIVDGYTLL